MQKIRVEEAVGMRLLHDMTAISEDGYKGPRFKRGHVIQKEDIPAFLEMGKNHIYVEEKNEGLVHEEEAALRVLEKGTGQGLSWGPPSEGRYKVTADYDGLFVLNEAGLSALNRTPDYTFAVLRQAVPVRKGELCVGARIVPLMTEEENLRQAVQAAERYYPLFKVLPYRPLKTAIVITGTEIYEGRIDDAFEAILRRKLRAYSAEVIGAKICPDEKKAIEAAAEGFLKEGAELLLMTGGMSVDPDDLTPGVIRRLSEDFLFQGLPVQPGNMLTIGKKGSAYLVGVPGASMHAPVTSLDLFLPRIFAGFPFDRETALAFGEGGIDICRRWPDLAADLQD